MSWGEQQHGAADCMIADVFDPAKGRRTGEPYIIARSEFQRTYKLVPEAEKKKLGSKDKREKS